MKQVNNRVNFHSFTVDARTIIHLGRDSIKDNATALLEIVKNCYDADSLNVEIEIYCSKDKDYIRIADNGTGMSKEELINNWLRIGYSKKKNEKYSKLGRRKTGEKGIGRISADRLGVKLTLLTKKKDMPIVGIKIDWDEFEKDNKNISDIQFEIYNAPRINTPHNRYKDYISGTELIISQLRQKWTKNNLNDLIKELSTLISPFNAINNFNITLKSDVVSNSKYKIETKYFEASEIDFSAKYNDSKRVLSYAAKNRFTKNIKKGEISLNQLIPNNDISDSWVLGDVDFRILLFVREKSYLSKTNYDLEELKNFLNLNSGIKIYRDNFVVRPYGFPHLSTGYDWLNLGVRKAQSPAGIARGASYKVNPNQLVGVIKISRDNNPFLLDSAGREGLVDNASFRMLQVLTQSVVNLIEQHRYDLLPYIKDSKSSKKSISEIKDIEIGIKNIRSSLTDIHDRVTSQKDKSAVKSLIKPINSTISSLDNLKSGINDKFNELYDWLRVLNGVATVGIASITFGHEIEASITQIIGSLNNCLEELATNNFDKQSILEELNEAYVSATKVDAWGNYALTRVNNERRKKSLTSINDLTIKIIDELQNSFSTASIRIDNECQKIETKIFPLDFETIIINLLTNSYAACKHVKRERVIKISLKKHAKDINGYDLIVSDSGNGIAPEFLDKIFNPLFSTKTESFNGSQSVGTGLGLTIVKSIVEQFKGSIFVDHDSKLKGARFTIWLPIEE